ncbi:MAG: elongation factor P [Candidatus Roizmanbacteria bacterium]|nr:elongation factor P [Candidatus Roizmanbacteria bacterium]
MSTQAGNLKRGEFLRHLGEIWHVQKTEFYSPGKGSALMRTKLKNVTSGKTIDYNYKSNESVDTVEVGSMEMQYLYKDQEKAYFMNNETFQQYDVSLSVIGNVIDYFKEGETMYVYVHDEKTLNIRPPVSVNLKIVQTEDAARGDTVSGAKKEAELETGAKVMVPLFIKKGEVIVINPETGEYTGRAQS